MNEELPKKAKKGQPCNMCGYCCSNEICEIGKIILLDNAKLPCPFLIQKTNLKTKEIKLVCHLVMIEKCLTIKPIITEALGIGKGCCSDDF